MKATLSFLFVGIISSPAAIITWDNGAAKANGDPETSYFAKDNWDTDSIPAATDEVRILTHGGATHVILNSTSATVNSIVCKVPLNLGDTITVTSSGSFENSLLAAGLGRIRANGPVTFKGNNSLNTITLDGSSHFTNEGTITFGTRGISPSTRFFNEGVFSLVSGLTNVGIFQNSGTFNMGGSGNMGSSTTFINQGTLRKDNPAMLSQLSGKLTQTSGIISVGSGAELTIDGLIQEFKGGSIQTDGTLILTQTIGGVPSRTFDGLTTISGDGTVKQTQEFNILKDLTVNLPNAPGYQIGSLVFGTPTSPSSQFINTGYLFIDSSPTFESTTQNVASDLFINESKGIAMQDATSLPTFDVTVENRGQWTTYGMKVKYFKNNHLLYLEGDSKRIDPVNTPEGGSLWNGEDVILGDHAFARYTIAVKYNQATTATTHLKNGLLTFEGGSNFFDGTFNIDSSERLNINNGIYEFYSLNFIGLGTATIGGSQLNPEIKGNNISYFRNKLGLNANAHIDDTKGLLIRSGKLTAGALINLGYINWLGGTLTADINNWARLDISPGITRTLNGTLANYSQTGTANIIQTASLTLAPPITPENYLSGGRIKNSNTHRIRPGASISGGGTSAYVNQGLLICENGASSVLSSTFDNRGTGTVQVTGASILSLPNLKNLSATGVLRGGQWEIDENAELLLPRNMTAIHNATWVGPGAISVTTLTGDSAVLKKTTSETHPNSLTCSDAAQLSLKEGTNTTMPALDLYTNGKITGKGKITFGGSGLNINSGIVAPGDSPGTLTVSGNAVFSTDSIYEWEASSSSTSDLLDIISGTATLSGTIRPSFIGGYIPSMGTIFTILTAPSITGTFDFIDHSALPPGLTFIPSYTSTSVILTVGSISLTTYESWKITRFTPAEQADILISGPNADPDKDGIINAAEYAYGMNPKSPDGSPVEIVAATATTIDLQFPWANGTEAGYSTENSSTLMNFTAISNTLISQTPLIPGLDQLTIRITIPSTDKAFTRLVVTLP